MMNEFEIVESEPTNAVLVKISAAERMLSEVRTLQDAVFGANYAEAVRAVAKCVGAAIPIINQAIAAKLGFERKAGEMLAKMDKAKGGGQRTASNALGVLGISWTQSSRWQRAASVPEAQFQEYIEASNRAGREITSAGLYKLADINRREDEKNRLGAQARSKGSNWRMEKKSCLDVLNEEAESIDCIITDPPYPRKFLPCFDDLGKVASHILKPGGSLIIMCGQSYLPEIISALCAYLTWHWCVAYLTPGGQAVQLFPRSINTFWKPLLWFQKGKYCGPWIGDVCRSPTNNNDKRFHQWGQSELGMLDIVDRFTQPGALVLDPFAGAGTTGIACLALDRSFIGYDIDETHATVARGRLMEFENERMV
jgi:16S rRNA G966 N2-methylase RsmD